MPQYKKEIINRIKTLAGSRSEYDVYCDWIECMAISIQNAVSIFGNETVKQEREKQFKRLVEQYENGVAAFGDMLGDLCMELTYNLSDVLGEVYMESEMGSKSKGQFFTPFMVSRLCAKLDIENYDLSGDEPIWVNEPSCGGGGMIIAIAKELLERGINYQKRLRVIAQDLDWKAVYMCYVQLSLLGIRAIVVQGDTLTEPYVPGQYYPPERVWRTPAEMGLLV